MQNNTLIENPIRDQIKSQSKDQLESDEYLLKLKTCIEKNPSLLNSQDAMRWTPLMEATNRGLEKTVVLLLDAGADATIDSFGQGTAIMRAIELNKPKIFTILLKNTPGNPDQYGLDQEKTSPLLKAVQYGSQSMVLELIEKGSNVNHTNLFPYPFRNNALSFAAFNKDEEMMKLLLEKGARFTSRSLFDSFKYLGFFKTLNLIRIVFSQSAPKNSSAKDKKPSVLSTENTNLPRTQLNNPGTPPKFSEEKKDSPFGLSHPDEKRSKKRPGKSNFYGENESL